MFKRIPILAAALLILSSALVTAAQTTVTTVTQLQPQLPKQFKTLTAAIP